METTTALKKQVGNLYYDDLLENFVYIEYIIHKLLNSELTEDTKAFRLKSFVLNWLTVKQVLLGIDE